MGAVPVIEDDNVIVSDTQLARTSETVAWHQALAFTVSSAMSFATYDLCIQR